MSISNEILLLEVNELEVCEVLLEVNEVLLVRSE